MVFSAVKFLKYINLFTHIKLKQSKMLRRTFLYLYYFSYNYNEKSDFKETFLCTNGIYFVLLLQ